MVEANQTRSGRKVTGSEFRCSSVGSELSILL